MATEDISELLREVPSTQPRRRRTSESQEQPPELLGPKDAEVEVVLLTLLCQQPPPRPWLQPEVLSSFGESGGPCLVAPAHRPARIMGYRYRTRAAPSPCTLVETAQSPQWLSTVCRRLRYRLVLWHPRAHHPSWTSRNPSIHSCGRGNLSRRKQRQLPRPLPLLTSCQSLQWMARCCHQRPLTSPSTSVLHCWVGRVPRSVQYPSWTVTAHRPVALAGQLTCHGQASKHIKKTLSL